MMQSVIAATGDDDQSVRVTLLADIRAIFAERRTDRLPSAELIEALVSIEGRPWAEWRAGKAITANGLARLLVPFGISPGTIRSGGGTPKGYQRAQFDDAFARYLPEGSIEPPQRHNLEGTGIFEPSATATPCAHTTA
jgi:hypothetical protein